MTEDEAEVTALQAIAFYAARPDAMLRLLAATGLTMEAMAATASERATQAAVLDYLSRLDKDVIAFADETDRDPLDVFHALRALDPTAFGESPPAGLGRSRKR
ncbi:MAG: DUF3572 family protein [Hyphomicrobiales bacterium]|nr:DUF3572 family protein [Hyphomicrobiales bacterium]